MYARIELQEEKQTIYHIISNVIDFSMSTCDDYLIILSKVGEINHIN